MLAEDKERAFVERELEKSGFPLEIEMSSFLEKRDWTVISSAFYSDLDLGGIQRETDLIAWKACDRDTHGNGFDPYVLRLTLVIQCKKSTEYHWVFYTRPRRRDQVESDFGLARTDFVDFARTRSLLPLWFPTLAIRHELQYGPLKGLLPPNVARTLIDTHQMRIAHPSNLRCLSLDTKSPSSEEVPRKKKMPEDLRIYNVAASLVKATFYERELSTIPMRMLFEKGSSEQQLLTEMKWPIDLFLPIVVFDGGIWRWDKGAERIDQVLLQVNLTSPNYVPPYPFVCIVNKHRFFELVEEIEEDLSKIADMIHDNVHSLNQQRTIIEDGIMGRLK